MLRLVCVLILLFVAPWNTWAAELSNPTRTPPKLVVVLTADHLATIVGIEPPSGSTGRVLTEILAAAATVTVPAPVPAAPKK